MKYKVIAILSIIIIAIISIFMIMNKKNAEFNNIKNTLHTDSSTSENFENNQNDNYQNKYYIDENILIYLKSVNMDAYKKIYDAIDNFENEVDLSKFNLSKDEFKKLKIAVSDRLNYELFYANGIKDDVENKKMIISYKGDINELKEKKKIFNEKVGYILNKTTKPEYSELQKTFSIYKYITENSKYNNEALNDENAVPSNEFDMCSILINNKGICYGYANTMKYLLNKAGIEAHCVTSPGHAWNIVKIDGEYYNLDASVATGENLIHLETFLFTDEEMTSYFGAQKNETYMGNKNYEKVKAPDCKSDKFRYLKDIVFPIMDEDKIYYADPNNEFKIYKMNMDGSSKEKVSDSSVYNMVIDGDYIYYSDKNNGMNLYMQKKDGTDRKILDKSMAVTYITIKNNKLYYSDKSKKIEKEISL